MTTVAVQAQQIVSEMTPRMIDEAIKVGERGKMPSGDLHAAVVRIPAKDEALRTRRR